MRKEPTFSLKDFMEWVSTHSDSGIRFNTESGIQPGDQVLIRLSEENMVKKLTGLNEDKKDIINLCKDLKSNGGTLKSIKGSNAVINVSGLNENVIVPRLYLRRAKKRN